MSGETLKVDPQVLQSATTAFGEMSTHWAAFRLTCRSAT